MAKKKWYVVWKGRKTGVFTSWEECKESVDAFEGAQYKSFPTEDEALLAHSKNFWQVVGNKAQSKEKNAPLDAVGSMRDLVLPSISVDAACSGNPGAMEYRGVNTATGEEIFRMGPFPNATNNIGEFLALVHGLAYMVQHNLPYPIYSDSINAISWVRQKHCKTKLAQTFANTPVFNLIARAETWLHTHSFTSEILKWPTDKWGEIPADFGRK